MTINLIVLGRLKEKYLSDAVSEYSKRISAFARLNVIELNPERLPDNPSDAQISAALSAEGERINAKLPAQGAVCAMCIEGKTLSSEELAEYISNEGNGGYSTISFIVGSSYGLSESIKNHAGLRLSMSKMTFPHQLARVMLLEQVYRALTIINNRKYHK